MVSKALKTKITACWKNGWHVGNIARIVGADPDTVRTVLMDEGLNAILAMTYCNGKGCALTATCRRWREGQRIIVNDDGDTDQHRFIDHCDTETREMYIGMMI